MGNEAVFGRLFRPGQCRGLVFPTRRLQFDVVVLANAVGFFLERPSALPEFSEAFSVRGRDKPSAMAPTRLQNTSQKRLAIASSFWLRA